MVKTANRPIIAAGDDRDTSEDRIEKKLGSVSTFLWFFHFFAKCLHLLLFSAGPTKVRLNGVLFYRCILIRIAL